MGYSESEDVTMKVLMFGWEFPPYNSGGLGVACQGLSRALSENGVEITFVLPKKVVTKEHFKFVFAVADIMKRYCTFDGSCRLNRAGTK